MQSSNQPAVGSKTTRWAGYLLSGLPAMLLLLDGVMKLVQPAPVVEGTGKLGFPDSILTGLGIVLLTCTILYLIPRTAVLGAILLTGYLGGAVASHVRVGAGWFEILFPAIFGALLWGGLYLRDPRVRALLPLRTADNTLER